nr:alpha/beta hydrolase-fold protein [Bacteroidales bacterium]
TANEQVMIWETAMYIPQLDRYRRIWVYLPQDYTTSTKSYRVLYMHDGQNVFDASTSFAGEWEVDETLTELENQGFETAIVVAVDNGELHRTDEYSPFINTQYGGGEGDAYLDFIIETLKPQIDAEFRTLVGSENTGIMGSSMGGLISYYAYFRNPEVFGKIGVFSPAFWFSEEYFSYSISQGKIGSPKIYLLAGALEAGFVESTQAMYDTLMDIGFTSEEVKIVIEADGQHSEWFWAREFKDAFMWLFNSEDISDVQNISFSEIQLFPNPAKDKLNKKEYRTAIKF